MHILASVVCQLRGSSRKCPNSFGNSTTASEHHDTAPKCKAMRSALLLFLLPGLAATDNAICAMLSPLIDGLDDAVPDLSCSCKSAGTASKIGGDAKCALTIGPPEVEGLEDMKITFSVGTTVQPCATPAMASVEAGITLPMLSSTEKVCSSLGSCSFSTKTRG